MLRAASAASTRSAAPLAAAAAASARGAHTQAQALALLSAHFAPAVTRSPKGNDLLAESASGSWVTEAGTRRRFLDLATGIGVANTGHAHPRVVAAIAAQAAKGVHLQQNCVIAPPVLELIEELLAATPPHLRRFFFNVSGAEAIESAVKLARHETGRQNVVVFSGGFHGRTLGTLAMTTSKTAYRVGYGPLPAGVHVAKYPYCLHCVAGPGAWAPKGGACCGEPLAGLKALLKEQSAPSDTAAILIEPILGEGGYVVPPPGFLRALREVATDAGALLIVDEVQSGVGRTGRWWGHEHEAGCEPDILVFAKGIASGVPLSGIATREGMMKKSPPGSMGGTYGPTALAAAAAVATLRVVREEGLLANAEARGAQLAAGLRALAARHPGAVADVRGRGCMIGLEFAFPAGSGFAGAVTAEAFARGLLLLTTGWRETIRFIPPLTISESEAAHALDIFGVALDAALKEWKGPPPAALNKKLLVLVLAAQNGYWRDVDPCGRAPQRGWTRLHQAARAGYAARVPVLVAAGGDVNAVETLHGKSPLHVAALHGRAAAVTALTAVPGIRVNALAAIRGGKTPLHDAVAHGHLGSVSALLAAPGIDVNSVDELNEITPLHIAATINRADALHVLLAAGVQPNARDWDGKTPLFLAAEGGETAALVALLGHPEVDVNSEDLRANTPLGIAVANACVPVITALLAHQCLDPNLVVETGDGDTALHVAVSKDDAFLVRLLLNCARVNPNVRRRSDSGTPLYMAVIKGSVAVVAALVSTPGTDPNLCKTWTEDGEDDARLFEAPLHAAARLGHVAIVRLLLAAVATDPNALNSAGETPLHLAAEHGHAAVVCALLSAPAIDAAARRDADGATPLHVACRSGSLAAVRALLAFPAVSVAARNDEGDKPNADVGGPDSMTIHALLMVHAEREERETELAELRRAFGGGRGSGGGRARRGRGRGRGGDDAWDDEDDEDDDA